MPSYSSTEDSSAAMTIPISVCDRLHHPPESWWIARSATISFSSPCLGALLGYYPLCWLFHTTALLLLDIPRLITCPSKSTVCLSCGQVVPLQALVWQREKEPQGTGQLWTAGWVWWVTHWNAVSGLNVQYAANIHVLQHFKKINKVKLIHRQKWHMIIIRDALETWFGECVYRKGRWI